MPQTQENITIEYTGAVLTGTLQDLRDYAGYFGHEVSVADDVVTILAPDGIYRDVVAVGIVYEVDVVAPDKDDPDNMWSELEGKFLNVPERSLWDDVLDKEVVLYA